MNTHAGAASDSAGSRSLQDQAQMCICSMHFANMHPQHHSQLTAPDACMCMQVRGVQPDPAGICVRGSEFREQRLGPAV